MRNVERNHLPLIHVTKSDISLHRVTGLDFNGFLPEGEYARKVNRSWLIRNYAGNLGNALFDVALARIFQPTSSITEKTNPQNSRYSILAMANVLSEHSNIAHVLDRLNKEALIPVIASIGGQSTSVFEQSTIHPTVMELLQRAEAGSGGWIGARGAFTSALLKSHGINRVVVNGCPSLTDRSPLWNRIQRPPSTSSVKHVGAIVQVTLHGGFRDVAGRLLQLAAAKNALYLTQSISEPPHEQISATWLAHYYAGATHGTNVDEWWKSRSVTPRDLPSWGYLLEKAEYVITMRIHGAIAAIRQGRPTLLVPFDTRTSELASYADLPTASISEVLSATHLDQLGELAVQRMRELDWDRFNTDSLELFNKQGLLNSNFSHRDSLSSFPPVQQETESFAELVAFEHLNYWDSKRPNTRSIARATASFFGSSRSQAECDFIERLA